MTTGGFVMGRILLLFNEYTWKAYIVLAVLIFVIAKVISIVAKKSKDF